jgi:hypothetical protein
LLAIGLYSVAIHEIHTELAIAFDCAEAEVVAASINAEAIIIFFMLSPVIESFSFPARRPLL